MVNNILALNEDKRKCIALNERSCQHDGHPLGSRSDTTAIHKLLQHEQAETEKHDSEIAALSEQATTVPPAYPATDPG